MKKMTIDGRRVKCRCCRKTAKIDTLVGPMCTHCFKGYALGLLVGRVQATAEIYDEEAKE